MRGFALALGGVLAASILSAQEFPRFTFNAGAGFTQPVGNTGRNLDTGWNAGVGAGMNFSQWVGANIQFNYTDMGINSGTLANIGVPGGDVAIWNVSLEPRVHLTPRSHFDLYIMGGGGWYHRTQEFTAPTTAIVTGFNPFFGFFPVAVAANQVLASSSVNKPGFDVGAGWAIGTKWHAKFFAEARWNHMFLDNVHDDWVPVTFGVTF